MSIKEQLSIEEAKAIMRGGLGVYELQRVTSFCAPLPVVTQSMARYTALAPDRFARFWRD